MKAPVFTIIFMLLFSGCANVLQSTPTVTPTFASSVTSTPASLPTITPVPTNTELPPCDADQTIKNLKSKISYSESAVLYNKMPGQSLLVVWFVDPEINPSAEENEIPENTKLAIRHALLLSQELNAADGCVSRLFNTIYAVVVDENYNGWFSGQILTARLPPTVLTDEKQLDEIAKAHYKISYLREKLPVKLGSVPVNSCAWPEAKQNLHNHFSSERENVGFYFVAEESSVDVWTQWDSQPDLLQFDLSASLLNVAREVDCLFPEPYMIVFQVVDETGQTLIVGYWLLSDAKNQDLGQIHIMYQK